MCLTLSEVKLIQLIPPESASNAEDIPDRSPACGCVLAAFLLTHSRLKQINLDFTLTLLQHKGHMSASFLSLTKCLPLPLSLSVPYQKRPNPRWWFKLCSDSLQCRAFPGISQVKQSPSPEQVLPLSPFASHLFFWQTLFPLSHPAVKWKILASHLFLSAFCHLKNPNEGQTREKRDIGQDTAQTASKCISQQQHLFHWAGNQLKLRIHNLSMDHTIPSTQGS